MRARARVREYRLVQGQARQTKSKKENRYVIKVMRFKQQTGKRIQFLRFARTKGCINPSHWAVAVAVAANNCQKWVVVYLDLRCGMLE